MWRLKSVVMVWPSLLSTFSRRLTLSKPCFVLFRGLKSRFLEKRNVENWSKTDGSSSPLLTLSIVLLRDGDELYLSYMEADSVLLRRARSVSLFICLLKALLVATSNEWKLSKTSVKFRLELNSARTLKILLASSRFAIVSFCRLVLLFSSSAYFFLSSSAWKYRYSWSANLPKVGSNVALRVSWGSNVSRISLVRATGRWKLCQTFFGLFIKGSRSETFNRGTIFSLSIMSLSASVSLNSEYERRYYSSQSGSVYMCSSVCRFFK